VGGVGGVCGDYLFDGGFDLGYEGGAVGFWGGGVGFLLNQHTPRLTILQNSIQHPQILINLMKLLMGIHFLRQ